MDLVSPTSFQEQSWPDISAVCSTGSFSDLDPIKDYCFIDDETAKTLELVHNNVDETNRRHSLMGYLNMNTSTTTGARLLRQGILRPFCNYEVIEHRLDCIDYLTSRVDVLGSIINCIRKYGQNIDLDNVVPCLTNLTKTGSATLHIAERRLDALMTLETLVASADSLVAALELADQPFLNVYKTALMDPAYADILSHISNVVEIDVKTSRGKRQKVFRIKSGVLPLFDIARNTYNVAITDLEQYVRELTRDDGIPWKLQHSESKGYFLTINANQMPKGQVLGPKYIRVHKTRSAVSCSTIALMQSNVRANVSYENSMKLANEVLTEALGNIMRNINSIQKLTVIVGMLDVVTNFAKLSVSSNGALVRPKFTATDTVLVRSRHPVLESILSVNNVVAVPNDVCLSTGSKNFMLVTGPNMGGKSVYLKQVGIIQIMAQLGCYVPAESAIMKVMNKIVARSGTSDDNQSSCSSFMWEMKGMATALKGEDSLSTLYLIDEVGRGTSIDDGASYSFAIAEELALRRYSFTVFSTHFDQVFTLLKLYPNVSAYHFEYEEQGTDDEGVTQLKITHNLAPGLAEKSNYGIQLADACGLPREILDIAMADAGMQI